MLTRDGLLLTASSGADDDDSPPDDDGSWSMALAGDGATLDAEELEQLEQDDSPE